jgi:hypothetical protein
MTTRHDRPDDDRELDAFLRGEDDLSAQLRGLDQPAPPPELDARIRAQAEAALREAAGAANDAEERALVTSPLGRWRAPLALAATVVIGVSLGLQWDGWREKEPRALSDAVAPELPAAAPAPAPAPEQEPVQPPPAVVQEVLPAAPVAKAPAPAPQRHRNVDQARAPVEIPAPAPPAPPVPPAAPAPALTDSGVVNYAPQRSLAEAPMPDTVEYARRSENGRRVEVTGNRIARPAPPAPPAPLDAAAERRASQGLQLIGELLDLHLDDEARTTWARFRAEFPTYPVPEGLRRRIEVLAPPVKQ